ncbi:DUF3995 domain-containing protein [Actinomycetes bacterium NPDC127524]
MILLMIGISAVLLIGIGCIHVYWAFGGTWGGNNVLPQGKTRGRQPVFAPGKMATIVVAFLVFSSALLLILQGGLFPVVQPNFVIKWGCWTCIAVFFLRVVGDFKYFGLFKKERDSRFSYYDTYLFTPLCLWFCFIFYAAIQMK